MSSAVCTAGLARRFGKTSVLENLNLEVPHSSVYGLIGPNGAGKTTTIKILMKILQPDSGTAEILGVNSRHLGPDHFRQIGYVSENQEMPEWMTIGYYLSYWKPFYPAWDDSLAESLMRQFGLPRDRRLRHLSRGMRMKAALVSSLAFRPRILILDEPFSGLDPLVREDLIEGLQASAEETTIFVSSHDLGEIESFASHIGYLDRGRLQFSEELKSLTERFREIEVVLDSTALFAAGSNWPEHWLRPKITPSRVRFVESRFDREKTASSIRSLFGNAQNVSINPMTLRAIFITMARNATKVS